MITIKEAIPPHNKSIQISNSPHRQKLEGNYIAKILRIEALVYPRKAIRD